MSPEIIIAFIALAAGPVSAYVSHLLGKRARRTQERADAKAFALRLETAKEEMEQTLWQRLQTELDRAYTRITDLEAEIRRLRNVVSEERGKREALEEQLTAERLKRQELEIELRAVRNERAELEQENGALTARVTELERWRKQDRGDTGPLG